MAMLAESIATAQPGASAATNLRITESAREGSDWAERGRTREERLETREARGDISSTTVSTVMIRESAITAYLPDRGDTRSPVSRLQSPVSRLPSPLSPLPS